MSSCTHCTAQLISALTLPSVEDVKRENELINLQMIDESIICLSDTEHAAPRSVRLVTKEYVVVETKGKTTCKTGK